MKIKLFAQLKDDFGSSTLDLKNVKPCNVSKIREILRSEFNLETENCMCAVNMKYVRDDIFVSDQDEIAFIPPVSGGSSDDFVEITEKKLNLSDYSFKKSTKYGAELIFCGISRDHNQGKLVQKLFYECYEEMARSEISNLIKKVKEKYDLGFVKVVHRIGEVLPGEISLIVIVSSVHRLESIKAIEVFLSLLKNQIPIWKKEIYSDNSSWIGKGA